MTYNDDYDWYAQQEQERYWAAVDAEKEQERIYWEEEQRRLDEQRRNEEEYYRAEEERLNRQWYEDEERRRNERRMADEAEYEEYLRHKKVDSYDQYGSVNYYGTSNVQNPAIVDVKNTFAYRCKFAKRIASVKKAKRWIPYYVFSLILVVGVTVFIFLTTDFESYIEIFALAGLLAGFSLYRAFATEKGFSNFTYFHILLTCYYIYALYNAATGRW